MHIVKVAYEATAFDARLTRGGTATMVWELARAFTAAGHQVSVVTPLHGKLAYLREHYDIEEIGRPDAHTIPLSLDPRVWPVYPPELAVRTRVFRMRREGVDIYFLANHYLDLLPDALYPANEMQGTDVAFLKPLVFQADAIRFVDRLCGGEPAVVQCYEPAYTYLIPPVMRTRPGKTTVSTVVVNTRIDETAHGPQLAALLRLFGADLDLSRYVDIELDDPLSTAMREYLRPSHLRHESGPDDVNYFAMVADCSDLIDFVSPGQLDYYSTFRDAPFENRFGRLSVSRVVQETAGKYFVGGCAMPDWWLARDANAVNRVTVLADLGLPPERPTFYHAARLAQNHKGQTELFRAIDDVLRERHEANFVIRCAVASAGGESAVGDPSFQEVADRYPDHVHLDWRMIDEEFLFDHAAAADFCLFPSKFELDGFLITMAEAMACGAVPVATAQETLSHYQHTRSVCDPEATGFAVPRSFRSNDLTMAARLKDRIVEAIRIFHDDPATYRRLARNSVDLARTFTWERSAAVRLDHFARAHRGDAFGYPYERAIEYGWFDRLPDYVWRAQRDLILSSALRRGDLVAYGRVATVDSAVACQLFDAAYRRADFDRCEQVAHLVDTVRSRRLRHRWRVSQDEGAYRVSYRYAYADRADLVVPARFSTGVGSGNRHTLPMTPDEGGFVAILPPDLAGGDLVVLLLLETGRVAWDLSPGFSQVLR